MRENDQPRGRKQQAKGYSQNRRQSASTLKKLEDAKKMLSKTLQLWPKDVEHLLNSEDCKFLQSMKTDRKATFGAVDDNLDRRNKRKGIRQEITAMRLKKLEEEKIASSASTPASPSSTRAALASESESC
jgi:hypothetical protein